jgi:catechol 2,3-dioxygenase-like lactoylglutathione lyase family enzyme
MMFATMRGMLVPARKPLAAVILALLATLPIAARADDGMVDVRTLPRLEGAIDDAAHTESDHLRYGVPTVVAITSQATKKLLAANGWVQYLRPMDEPGGSLLFKKGRQGLYVSFTQGLGRPDQSTVSYTANRLTASVPFPDDATNILFDERRPYLNCFTAAPVEASLDFFRTALTASGWLPLSAADAAADWPHAELDDKIVNGARAYFSYANRDGGYQQPPIMLSLRRRDDGRTSVEIRVAPFALPQSLGVARESAGLPVPDHTPSSGSSGGPDSVRRTVQGLSVADIPAVLAFYRRELTARNWKEETNAAAAAAPDEVTANFSSAEQTATLRLGRKYDLTVFNLATQMTEAALAARAAAKKQADDKFTSDADAMVKQVMAADEVRRAVQAAGLSDAPLHALADQTTPVPVPVPENAENIKFDGAEGKLEFDSGSSVKAIAAFYRGILKPQGWKEQPSVINKPTMVEMEFSKGGKVLSFTAMQMGPKVNVSADGSGLVMAAARSDAKPARASNAAAGNAAIVPLEAEPDSALPVPKQHSMSSIASGKLPGTDIPFRRELTASVPADLGSVLAFYRGELGKRGWKESAERAVVKPDQAELAFASPDGPAVLKLGRNDDETTVNLAQKIPAIAAKSEVMPKPGQAKLLLSNLGDGEATLTINKQAIRIAAGAGGPQAKGPTLELPPGKYRYSLKVAGGPVRTDEIELAADDAWGLMVGPGGDVLSLHVY